MSNFEKNISVLKNHCGSAEYCPATISLQPAGLCIEFAATHTEYWILKEECDYLEHMYQTVDELTNGPGHCIKHSELIELGFLDMNMKKFAGPKFSEARRVYIENRLRILEENKSLKELAENHKRVSGHELHFEELETEPSEDVEAERDGILILFKYAGSGDWHIMETDHHGLAWESTRHARIFATNKILQTVWSAFRIVRTGGPEPSEDVEDKKRMTADEMVTEGERIIRSAQQALAYAEDQELSEDVDAKQEYGDIILFCQIGHSPGWYSFYHNSKGKPWVSKAEAEEYAKARLEDSNWTGYMIVREI